MFDVGFHAMGRETVTGQPGLFWAFTSGSREGPRLTQAFLSDGLRSGDVATATVIPVGRHENGRQNPLSVPRASVGQQEFSNDVVPEIFTKDWTESRHPLTAFNYGLVLFHEARYGEARTWLARAVDVAKQEYRWLPQAYCLLSFSCGLLGDYEAAGDAMKKAAQPCPGSRFARFGIEQIRMMTRLNEIHGHDSETTIYTWELVLDELRSFQNFWTFHGFGCAAADRGDYEGAKAGWLGALREAPYFYLPAALLCKEAAPRFDDRIATAMLKRLKALGCCDHLHEVLSQNLAEYIVDPEPVPQKDPPRSNTKKGEKRCQQ